MRFSKIRDFAFLIAAAITLSSSAALWTVYADTEEVIFNVENDSISPTEATYSNSGTRSVSRQVVVNVHKTDADTGDVMANVKFDVYEDGVKVGTMTTDDNGNGSYTRTETTTITSDTFSATYASNYDDLADSVKTTTKTLAQAQAEVAALIEADLDAKEAEYKSATHEYTLKEHAVTGYVNVSDFVVYQNGTATRTKKNKVDTTMVYPNRSRLDSITVTPYDGSNQLYKVTVGGWIEPSSSTSNLFELTFDNATVDKTVILNQSLVDANTNPNAASIYNVWGTVVLDYTVHKDTPAFQTLYNQYLTERADYLKGVAQDAVDGTSFYRYKTYSASATLKRNPQNNNIITDSVMLQDYKFAGLYGFGSSNFNATSNSNGVYLKAATLTSFWSNSSDVTYPSSMYSPRYEISFIIKVTDVTKIANVSITGGLTDAEFDIDVFPNIKTMQTNKTINIEEYVKNN